MFKFIFQTKENHAYACRRPFKICLKTTSTISHAPSICCEYNKTHYKFNPHCSYQNTFTHESWHYKSNCNFYPHSSCQIALKKKKNPQISHLWTMTRNLAINSTLELTQHLSFCVNVVSHHFTGIKSISETYLKHALNIQTPS